MEHTRQKGDDLESMYCSEFVAETLQRCGMLGEAYPTYSYHPKDFLPGDLAYAKLDANLLPGASYSPCVTLVLKGTDKALVLPKLKPRAFPDGAAQGPAAAADSCA